MAKAKVNKQTVMQAAERGIAFNINEYVRVRLTHRGKVIHRHKHDVLTSEFPGLISEYLAPEEDAEGWSKWQAWDLMNTFGAYLYNGGEPPFETEIKILVTDAEKQPARRKK